MAHTPEQSIRSKFIKTIERNRQFSQEVADNLLLYQQGLHSPAEFLRSLQSQPVEAEAHVITPDPLGEFPISNILIVRRVPQAAAKPLIEVHDPFLSTEYRSVVLGANHKRMFPQYIFRHTGEHHRQVITKKDKYDYQVGVGIVNWFEVSSEIEHIPERQ